MFGVIPHDHGRDTRAGPLRERLMSCYHSQIASMDILDPQGQPTRAYIQYCIECEVRMLETAFPWEVVTPSSPPAWYDPENDSFEARNRVLRENP